MAVSKPSTYPIWTDGDPSKVTQPPSPQLLSGWTAGEPIPFQYLNWLFWLINGWVEYLDQTVSGDVTALNLDQTMRLINGGNWSWNLSTSTLAWSSAFNLAIPSITDAQNQAASGSIASLADGQVAYVNANVPIITTGNTTSSSNQITNIPYAAGITTGMAITGTNIPGSTTVTAIVQELDGTFTFTISNNATGNGSALTLTVFSTGALTVLKATSSSLVPSPNTVIIARRVGNNVYVGVNAFYMALRDAESKPLSENDYLNIFTATAGESLTAGNAVYISKSGDTGGRTAGSAYKCDSGSTNGANRAGFAGFVISSVSSSGTAYILTGGVLNGLTSLVAGTLYYADPSTPGAITSTKPVTTGQWVTPVGMAISTTQLQLNAAILATSLQISSSLTQSFELLNLGLATSVSAGALTIALKQSDGATDPSTGLNAVKAGFRSSVLTAGNYNERSVTAALSQVLSSGTTLGIPDGVVCPVNFYLIDSDGSGAMKLGVSTYPLNEATTQRASKESAAVTCTNASPCVVTEAGNNRQNGDAVVLSGSVPTGFTAGVTYFIANKSGSTYELTDIRGNPSINSSSTGTSVVVHIADNVLATDGYYTAVPVRYIGRAYSNNSSSGVWLAPTELDLSSFSPQTIVSYDLETTSGQSIPTGVNTTIIFDTVLRAVGPMSYDTTTGVFTCVIPGNYQFDTGFLINPCNQIAGNSSFLYLVLNFLYQKYVARLQAQAVLADYVPLDGSRCVPLLAGDKITVNVNQANSASSLNNAVGLNYLNIDRISD